MVQLRRKPFKNDAISVAGRRGVATALKSDGFLLRQAAGIYTSNWQQVRQSFARLETGTS